MPAGLASGPQSPLTAARLAALGVSASTKAFTVTGTTFANGEVGVINSDGTVTRGQPNSTEALAQIEVIAIGSGRYAGPGSLVPGFSGLTPGVLQYLAVNGGRTETPPTSGYSVILGRAWSATQLYFNPREPFNLG